jgi:hypothetical protein
LQALKGCRTTRHDVVNIATDHAWKGTDAEGRPYFINNKPTLAAKAVTDTTGFWDVLDIDGEPERFGSVLAQDILQDLPAGLKEEVQGPGGKYYRTTTEVAAFAHAVVSLCGVAGRSKRGQPVSAEPASWCMWGGWCPQGSGLQVVVVGWPTGDTPAAIARDLGCTSAWKYCCISVTCTTICCC